MGTCHLLVLIALDKSRKRPHKHFGGDRDIAEFWVAHVCVRCLLILLMPGLGGSLGETDGRFC